MLHSHTSGFGKDLPQTERLLQLRIVGLQVDFPPPRTTGRLHNFPARNDHPYSSRARDRCGQSVAHPLRSTVREPHRSRTHRSGDCYVAIDPSPLFQGSRAGPQYLRHETVSLRRRIEGPGRYKTMTLEAGEFIRRFLLHVLPKGFHRMRHPGRKARPCSPTHRRRSECRFTTARRSARNLRCDNPSLPALRQLHGDHREVRGASQLSPSTLNAVLNTPHQHLMTLHTPITRACGLGLRQS